MLVGYCRVSTAEQLAGFEQQERELKAAGAEKIFNEKISSLAARRDQLEAALDFIREGDVLVVTRLDRLARSVRDLLEIVTRIERKRAHLRILAMSLDTQSATGRLMLQVLGAVAEFETQLMKERQRIGIAKARAEGRYKGRTPTAVRKTADILRLSAEGLEVKDIATTLKISRSSVYRLIKLAKCSDGAQAGSSSAPRS